MTGLEAARETIRVEAASRWDALDLAARLTGLHTYLVQLGDSRWLVCVRAEDGDVDLLERVRTVAAEWAVERSVDSTVTAGGRRFALHH